MTAANQSRQRRFLLERTEDVSGTSGVGVVAEGVQFSNGTCVLHWLSQLTSVSVYENSATLIAIHGHGGRTALVWVDGDEATTIARRPSPVRNLGRRRRH